MEALSFLPTGQISSQYVHCLLLSQTSQKPEFILFAADPSEGKPRRTAIIEDTKHKKVPNGVGLDYFSTEQRVSPWKKGYESVN